MYKEVFAMRIKSVRKELGLTQIQVSKDTEGKRGYGPAPQA